MDTAGGEAPRSEVSLSLPCVELYSMHHYVVLHLRCLSCVCSWIKRMPHLILSKLLALDSIVHDIPVRFGAIIVVPTRLLPSDILLMRHLGLVLLRVAGKHQTGKSYSVLSSTVAYTHGISLHRMFSLGISFRIHPISG